jgi:lipopolysaccharide transport system ATP-binding protein
MSKPAIVVENLSKAYRIGLKQERFPTFRDALVNAVKSPLRRLRHLGGEAGSSEDTFWALKDVSFQVQPGEVVGIIGRNGAGKSTLLKVLSRITEPTSGCARLRGRVASLLEVGTGFHPELTGRENIYLNGAILGMKRAEIARKFDEIVAFSEVEKFLDTPVKHYSSGMYVRLAFAVAAHLEPEVLIVDEVLAVGDAEFQKKCLGKIGEVAKGLGRTVLFVSHNMTAVQSLCPRGIFLRQGAIVTDGPVDLMVAKYLESIEQSARLDLSSDRERSGRGEIRLTSVDIHSGCNADRRLATGSPASFRFQLSDVRPGLACSFTIYDSLGHSVANFGSNRHGDGDSRGDANESVVVCQIDELLLLPGKYRLNVAVSCDGELQDHIEGSIVFQVYEGIVRGRAMADFTPYGSVYIPHRWVMPRSAELNDRLHSEAM